MFIQNKQIYKYFDKKTIKMLQVDAISQRSKFTFNL